MAPAPHPAARQPTISFAGVLRIAHALIARGGVRPLYALCALLLGLPVYLLAVCAITSFARPPALFSEFLLISPRYVITYPAAFVVGVLPIVCAALLLFVLLPACNGSLYTEMRRRAGKRAQSLPGLICALPRVLLHIYGVQMAHLGVLAGVVAAIAAGVLALSSLILLIAVFVGADILAVLMRTAYIACALLALLVAGFAGWRLCLVYPSAVFEGLRGFAPITRARALSAQGELLRLYVPVYAAWFFVAALCLVPLLFVRTLGLAGALVWALFITAAVLCLVPLCAAYFSAVYISACRGTLKQQAFADQLRTAAHTQGE